MNYPVSSPKQIGLEKASLSNTGAELETLLIKREAFWIFRLVILTPRGLNEGLDSALDYICSERTGFFLKNNQKYC